MPCMLSCAGSMVNSLDRSRVILPSLLLVGALACAPEHPLDPDPPQSCEVVDRNIWLYDLMQDVYLWETMLPEVDPTTFESPEALMSALRYADIDRWSRIRDKTTTNALFMEGKSIGTGFSTKWDGDRLRVSSVQVGTPAYATGMQRGDEILSINGVTVPDIEAQDLWGEIWGPNEPDVSFALEFSAPNGVVATSLTKAWIELVTVPHYSTVEAQGRTVGYLHFTSFLGPSEGELRTAFQQLQQSGVTELVVDLRYNGGGLVSIAEYLVNLLVGATASGQVAYKVAYNKNLAVESNSTKHVSRPDEAFPLTHVIFLVTGSTASASELVINAVRPHVAVSIVGSATAGKPVGSNLFEFCDSIASPITFELLNANDEGRYFDGILPQCEASDDLDHPLGDPAEGMMAQAFAVLGTGACAPVPVEERPEASVLPAWKIARERPAPTRYPEFDELRGWM